MTQLTKHKVTIGVASYNNAKYIIDTLESVRKQTYSNLELIIVDDCSTDNSVQIIEKWLKEQSEFNARFIQHESNFGLCTVCNTILSNANGKYISILGSDDVYLPEKVARQVDELQRAGPDYAIIYSDMYVIDEQGNRAKYTQLRSLEPGFIKDEGNIFELEIVRNRINTPSVMVVTQLIRDVGGYDEELVFEDWDMWLRLSKYYKVKYSPFISVEYRLLSTSLWNKRGKSFYESSIKCLVKHLGFSKETDKLIIKGVSEYAQLIYKLYGRNAKPWLKLAHAQNPTIKLKILLSLSTIGMPYFVYNIAARLMNKRND